MDFNTLVQWFETELQSIPTSTLDIWGQAAFIVGVCFMFCAYSGFTPRPGGKWGFGWQRSTWDSTAFYSVLITFVLVISSGFAGSFFVIVPGAQTFESLKDLSVFICVILFGYPALIAVPFAYGVSDLVEGVPPEFLRDWSIGYFINPSCFWLAAILIGKDPDFKKMITWRKYLLFVVVFLAVEPIMWGYICSGKYTAEISYRNITPALFFTTSLTWILAPFTMLVALPAAKRLGLFWADIPYHSSEQVFGHKEHVWQSGKDLTAAEPEPDDGVPIRIMLVAPFFVLVLTMVSVTAYFTLQSSGNSAFQLAVKLHEQVTESVQADLKSFLKSAPAASAVGKELDGLLKKNSMAGNGRAFIIDKKGEVIASSKREISGDQSELKFIRELKKEYKDLRNIKTASQQRIDIIKTKPLLKETWLVQVAPFTEPEHSIDWIIITALPQSYYLEGIHTGSSQSALVFSVAIILVMIIVGILSKLVTDPIRSISSATKLLAEGHLDIKVPGSHLQELNTLSKSFNEMSAKLKATIDALNIEIRTRMAREKELEKTKALVLQNEDRLKLAIKAADLGTWDWNVETGKLIWDEGMYKLYGFKQPPPSWTFNEWLQCLLPEDREPTLNQIHNSLNENTDYTAEFRIKWSDGSIHFIKAIGRITIDTTGQPVRMVGVNYDVSYMKNYEQNLIASRDEALKANRAKSEFLANMSHEIRTPLNTILGMSSILNDSSLDENQRKCVSILNKSSEHLLYLINDIIDANIIETRGIKLENANFDLHNAIKSSVEFLTAAAQKKNISISASIGDDVPQFVIGDEHRLKQIFINLLGNAVKFTEEGEVVICAEKDKNSNDPNAVLFSIKDTGIGIPKDQQAMIFERFTQGNSSLTRKHEGTGLGLSITKYLIELMGSHINIQSEPGKGSCFSFTIIQKLGNTVTKTAEQVDQIPDLKDLNVLIVDDSPDNKTLMEYYLKKTNCHLDTASDGEEAIKKFRAGHYDMIFMDIQMPGIDGYMATKQIREWELEHNLEHTPIAALTAFALKEEETKSFEAGCDFHITKPVKKTVIINTLIQVTGSQT